MRRGVFREFSLIRTKSSILRLCLAPDPLLTVLICRPSSKYWETAEVENSKHSIRGLPGGISNKSKAFIHTVMCLTRNQQKWQITANSHSFPLMGEGTVPVYGRRLRLPLPFPPPTLPKGGKPARAPQQKFAQNEAEACGFCRAGLFLKWKKW